MRKYVPYVTRSRNTGATLSPSPHLRTRTDIDEWRVDRSNYQFGKILSGHTIRFWKDILCSEGATKKAEFRRHGKLVSFTRVAWQFCDLEGETVQFWSCLRRVQWCNNIQERHWLSQLLQILQITNEFMYVHKDQCGKGSFTRTLSKTEGRTVKGKAKSDSL